MGRRKSRLPKLIACAVLGLGVWLVAGAPRGCDRGATRGGGGSNKAIVLNPTTRTSPPAGGVVAPPAGLGQAPAASRPALAGGGPVATSKPAAEKPSSQMMINGVLVNFPEAKLQVRKEGDKLTAILVSNDPPEVINPTYQGNRYYFEMALDGTDDVKNLADAEFRYKAPSADESQDTPNGIFLDGDRQHLEPYDIGVTFDREGDHLVAEIRGQFIYFPNNGAVGQWVPVVARLAARAETK